jgi:hypothetical protein
MVTGPGQNFDQVMAEIKELRTEVNRLKRRCAS